MWKQIVNSLLMVLSLTVLTGLVYPLIMTGLAQAVFPVQANGSIIAINGQPVGSGFIGQNFTNPGYFHGRPSAAGTDGYDATASSGSNLGPTNQNLEAVVIERVAIIRKDNNLPGNRAVPSDLALASGSGLDPHISPAAAYIQVERVAKERGLTASEVRKLVESQVEGRQMGFLGEPKVNVLKLNLVLDTLKHQ